jgi:hypothetical protein
VLQHEWLQTSDLSVATPAADVSAVRGTINKLKHYKAPKRLKAEAIKVLFQYMTAENYEELLRIFKSLDTEHTGYITAKNLRTAL